MESHGPILVDVIEPTLKVVFCGMAAGTRSAQLREYYAGPGNRFWPTLHEVGFTDVRLQPAQYKEVLKYGIGLTDIIKHQFGSDAQVTISDDDRAELEATVRRYTPRFLAFNGKGSAKVFWGIESVEYGLQDIRIGNTRVFVLPSTSRAANGFWSIEPWHELYLSAFTNP